MDLTNLTIKEAHKGLSSKKFSSKELTKAFIKRIEEKDDYINAFISRTFDLALDGAKEADKYIAEHKQIDILCGIPCAIKDNILIKGVKCTSATKILENYIASYDATCIKKLKEKKAVFLGKTNMDEFAMGSSCETSYFGPTRNPRNTEYVPGGSSGGSAAAVASDMCVYALGSDTGGSIRQPSSFCGTVGLKPTYGSVSRYGVMAFASSLDQIGPIAKNVEDVEYIFNSILGKDKKDSTSLDYKKTEAKDIKEMRIGIPKQYFGRGLNCHVEEKIRLAIENFKNIGAKMEEIELPHAEYALACYYILAPAEASSNLARFDGIKYGYSSKNAEGLKDIYYKSRGEGMGKEVKRRIMLGTYTLSSGYYDAYYKKALKVRTLIKKDFEDAFKKVDLILGPTSPILPFKIGEKFDDPLSMYLADIYTVSINLAGVPAMSVPAQTCCDGLPVGLQLIGPYFSENNIFEAAKAFEKYNV